MMRSKKWIIVLLVLIVLVVAGVWWWKSPSSDKTKDKVADKVTPTISVASVNVTDIDAERIQMQSKVTIRNTLPVDVNSKRVDFVIYIDSMKVIEDSYQKPISIKSSDSTTFTLPMQVLAEPLAKMLKYFDAEKIDSADYTMKASFEVDVPIAGERKFDMEFTKRLPAFRLPKVKVNHVDLNALAMKSKGMDVEINLTNPNVFPLKMTDGAFSFAMEDALKMDGVMEKVINVPAKGSQDISIHTKVTDGSMLKSGWKILTDKKDTHFTCLFSGRLNSDNKALSDSKMVMKVTGTLDEIMNAAKK